MPLRLGHRRRPHRPRQRQRRLTRALLRQAGRPAVRRAAARAQPTPRGMRRKAGAPRRVQVRPPRHRPARTPLRRTAQTPPRRRATASKVCRAMPPPGRPAQDFTWNGRGNNGVTWPDGSYTISISATGANGQPGRRLDTGARRYQRRRCRPDPASAHRGRAKGADQPDPIDQPLTIPVPFPGAGKTPVIRGSA